MTRCFKTVCVLPFPDCRPSAPPENAIGGADIEPQSGQTLLDSDAFFAGQRLVFRSRGGRLRTVRRQDAFASRPSAWLAARSGAYRADDVAAASHSRVASPQRSRFRLLERHSGLALRIAELVHRKCPATILEPCELDAVRSAAGNTGVDRFRVRRVLAMEIPRKSVRHALALVGLAESNDAMSILRAGGIGGEQRGPRYRCCEESGWRLTDG